MKTRNYTFSILLLMFAMSIASCSIGNGDRRDRNLEKAMLEYCPFGSDIKYVGMSDVSGLDGGRFETVIVYYVVDSIGNRIERNARVITNDDCSEIYTWEDLDSHVLDDTKRKINEKLEEKGIALDSDLIDALIELKGKTRKL